MPCPREIRHVVLFADAGEGLPIIGTTQREFAGLAGLVRMLYFHRIQAFFGDH